MRKILNVATFGVAGLLLGKKKKDAPVEAPAAPTAMPTADDETVRLARKRSIVQSMGRRGRASTDLTGGTLGG